MKSYLLFFSFFISFFTIGQNKKIDNYKYVIVPERFYAFKEKDQYQTSSLLKFLLEKKGFEVYLDSEQLPEEVAANRCNALTAIVLDESGLLNIKTAIQIEDCYGNILYTSEEGRTKIKDYKRGYQEALKDAYAKMTDLSYSYTPIEDNTDKIIAVQKDDEKEEILASKVKKEVVVIAKDPITKASVKQNNKPDFDKLYAQPNENGYQLVDTKPSVVFIVLKTSNPNTMIIKDKNGTLTKKGDVWIAEYYENDKKITKSYQIKF